MTASIAGRADWLDDPALRRLMAALNADGEEARIAGGAVRNALLGEAVEDIDIATTALPEETIARAHKAGFKTVPTGIAHGTVTVFGGGRGFEVTTLRADVETDGRHANVAFGRDWKTDAERRDFTVNALYATAEGEVIDLVGGLADLERRTIRFIGDADARIREDYLRILRFFRFFARYGSGRPDAEGLMACARAKSGLGQLSAERVWAELKKLLGADDPSRALLWMRQAGVLTAILPESEKWGIDAIHGLVAAERDLGWPAEPLTRLAAIIPPDGVRIAAMAKRLRFSRAEADRLADWAMASPPAPDTTEAALAKLLYAGREQGIRERLRLALASARVRAVGDSAALMEAAGFARLLKFAENWARPVFPIGGEDLKRIGAAPGPEIGKLLGGLESEWIASGFALTRDALIERAAQQLSKN